MKKIAIISVTLLFVLTGIICYFTSNLSRSFGEVSFSKGDKPGLNSMKVYGPYGWYFVTFEKSKVDINSNELKISGKGRAKFPLFGEILNLTNYYPSEGEMKNIPLEKEYLYYKPNGNFECYLLITKDPNKYELLH